jgi:hypothetical protein
MQHGCVWQPSSPSMPPPYYTQAPEALMSQQGFQHGFEGGYAEQNYFLPSNTDYENCVVNPGYHNATTPVQDWGRKQIEHAQYLISRWGLSDDAQADTASPYPQEEFASTPLERHFAAISRDRVRRECGRSCNFYPGQQHDGIVFPLETPSGSFVPGFGSGHGQVLQVQGGYDHEAGWAAGLCSWNTADKDFPISLESNQQMTLIDAAQEQKTQGLQWDNLPTGSVVTSQYPEEPPPPGVTEECPRIFLYIQQVCFLLFVSVTLIIMSHCQCCIQFRF